MHYNTPVKIFFIFVALFVVGLIYSNSGDKGSQKLASLKPNNEIIKRTSKLIPYFNVTLSNANLEDGEKSNFTLTANINTSKLISTLKYEWVLPEGVTLLGGQLASGTLTNISARSGHDWHAQFSNISTENKKIHLRIWAIDTPDKMVSTAQYNTLDQKNIDLEQQELGQRADEYLADHPELLKKYK